MNTSNRAAILTKTHTILNQHYKPVSPPADRPLLEHLLYACCLENSLHEAADEAFAKLQQIYYDWNEVRVTTITELAEVMSVLKDPRDSAARLKISLQSVFETYYSFDLESFKKQNQGKVIKELEKLKGVNAFVRSYITQAALGGHSIPTSRGVRDVLVLLDVINQSQADQQRVPGLERAIPKSKGIEFGSLIHQLGADFFAAPYSPRVRSIILEIDPSAKKRLPKRGAKKAAAEEAKPKRGRKAQKSVSDESVSAAKQAGPDDETESDAGQEKIATEKKSATKRIAKQKPK